MQYDLQKIQELPDILSLDDFRIACHIAKKTARYYLASGLLPHQNTGKQTRCYAIDKKDLLQMLADYEFAPAKYEIPALWHLYGIAKPPKTVQEIFFLPSDDATRASARDYYEQILAPLPDILCVSQVSAITGYSSSAINGWHRSNKLPGVCISTRLWVQKDDLLSFLLSSQYDEIRRKSFTHLSAIREICGLKPQKGAKK